MRKRSQWYWSNIRKPKRDWWPKGFTCPKCGAVVKSGETFCRECGKEWS